MKPLSKKHESIEESKTLAINAKANALKSRGVKVINFSSGEPDFKTPRFIRDAAKDFIEQGHIRYTPSAGILPLKEAICEKLKRDNNLTYQPSNIVVSAGAKHSLYNVFQALLNPNDEVIIPSPYWTSYPAMVELAGGKPVLLETYETAFQIDMTKLERLINEKSKAIILNSPNNPTGVIYPRSTLEAIAKLAIKHDLYVVSDEIYEKLLYEGTHVSIAALGDAIKQRTITINGLSKSHAMTGWRIGYLAADESIVKIITNLQSHSTSNASTITQHAALAALKGSEADVEMMRNAFEKRRKMVLETIDKLPLLTADEPQGAFYVMINVKALFGHQYEGITMHSASDVARVFLEHAHVAMVPGIAFGCDDYLRMSYATSETDIEEGLNRISDLLETLNQ